MWLNCWTLVVLFHFSFAWDFPLKAHPQIGNALLNVCSRYVTIHNMTVPVHHRAKTFLGHSLQSREPGWSKVHGGDPRWEEKGKDRDVDLNIIIRAPWKYANIGISVSQRFLSPFEVSYPFVHLFFRVRDLTLSNSFL